MKITRKKIYIAVVISLLLHLVIISVAAYLEGLKKSMPKEEIVMVDLTKDDWKIADIKPPKEERPENSHHLGMYDSKTEKEMVSDKIVRAPGRPETRGGKGIDNYKKDLDKIFEDSKMKGPKKIVKKSKDRISEPFATRMPEDFYPDYKRGPHTYINVLKHPDVTYFVMLKRVFKLAWDPTSALMRHRAIGGQVSRGSIKVVLGISINKTGAMEELFVINGSGLSEYDAEALRAVKASAPFSAPPTKLMTDGTLRLTWTFIVYL